MLALQARKTATVARGSGPRELAEALGLVVVKVGAGPAVLADGERIVVRVGDPAETEQRIAHGLALALWERTGQPFTKAETLALASLLRSRD